MFVSTWLYFVVIAFLILSNYLGIVVSAVLLVLVCLIKYRKIPLLIVWVVFLTIVVRLDAKVNKDDIYRVTQIKANYLIAANARNGKIIIYDKNNSLYGDLVSVADLIELKSNRNPLIFDFSAYLRHSGIRYQGIDPRLKKSASTLSTLLYKRFLGLSEIKREYVLTYLYNQKSPPIFDNIVYSGGLAHKSLINGLCVLINYWLDKKYHAYVNCLLYFILYILFPGYAALLIGLLYSLLKLVATDKAERLMMLSLIFLTIDRSLLIHGSFLFLYLSELGRFINLRDDYLGKKFTLIFLQLLLFKSANLFLTIFFKLYRVLLAITIFSTLMIRWVPESFLLYWQSLLGSLNTFAELFTIDTVPGYLSLLLFIVLLSSRLLLCKLLLPLILPLVQFQSYLDPWTTVTVLSVNQADCAVIKLPFNSYNLMIDAGETYYGKNVETIILPYLKASGIFGLNALILTHADHDHIGGAENILKQQYVKELIYLPQRIDHDDFSLLIPDDLNTTVNYQGLQPDNESSLVCLFYLKGIAYAFLADISSVQEKILTDNYRLEEFQILKLAHHGSKTAGSEEILSLANWQYALISSGRNNLYGHPSAEVLERLDAYNLPYLTTAEEGYLQIKSLGPLHFIITGSGKFGIIKQTKR